ncbi:MAG: peptidase [Bdellovibrionales bacterium GWA2_49_15]|nr:MAG: peptidase [Bdellovibrionales bacterium GWA2_49_15]HAZ14917.1 peptidase [Bdellovibrionales bacterium]
MSELDARDLLDLEAAVKLLESPTIAAKLTDVIGAPIEKGYALLPSGWQKVIHNATEAALKTALNLAISTMSEGENKIAQNGWHKLAVGLSGALGGFFGLPALVLELPASTTIMLRSIMDIARAQGELISHAETKMACMEVFALGGRAKNDDASESGYFATRAFLAKSVSEAAAYIAEKGLAGEGAPALVRLTMKIGQRFGLAISEKAAAQAIPIIGAAGGSIINVLFIKHFQDMAKGHFIVRKLERKYGLEVVQENYLKLKQS